MKTFDQSFFLSVKELEAAHYYISFGCPALAGVPDFNDINPDLGEPVTYIEGTDFTEEEYTLLELGEATVEKISGLIAQLIRDDNYDGEKLKGILF